MSLTVRILIVTLSSSLASGAELSIPAQHPYLALTPDDIARAEGRIARFAWAKQSLANLVNQADDIVRRPLGKLPEKGDDAHHGIGSRLFTAAVAHALTRERRYAEWVRDGLVAYADLYPTLPMTNGRCKVFSQSSLYEATWLVPVVQAYDLVAASGVLTDAQKKHIEDDLLREAVKCFKVDDYEHDPRIGDLHYRCYNFQAWHISAVGLAGLALCDRALVDWAVDGRYGFKHLVAHDILADGLTNSPTEKMPMLVLRHTGPRATFVTVIEPVDEASPLRGVRRRDDRLGLERSAGTEEVRLE
jgi:hypothetical protein